jgi:hypothetical protein
MDTSKFIFGNSFGPIDSNSQNDEKDKSKYSCKFCNTEDENLFRESRFISCRSCESLCTKYRKYYKEINNVGTDIILLCDICNTNKNPCDKCRKIQIHIQDTTFETQNPTYICKHCKTTNEKNFETHRKKICRKCYNKTNNLKYIKKKSDSEIETELNKQVLDLKTLSENFYILYEKVTKLEEENLKLRSIIYNTSKNI